MTPQTQEITLHQLLTMSAGLPTDDVFYPAVLDTTKDWVATICKLGTTGRPGNRFAYSSAGSHLLSAALSEATGRSVLDYAREKLFNPLGIDTLPAAEPVFVQQNPRRMNARRSRAHRPPRTPFRRRRDEAHSFGPQQARTAVA